MSGERNAGHHRHVPLSYATCWLCELDCSFIQFESIFSVLDGERLYSLISYDAFT